VLKLLRSLLSSETEGREPLDHADRDTAPPECVAVPGAPPFDLKASLQYVNGLPVPDWDAVSKWLQTISAPEELVRAWGACEIAWLHHLRAALGPGYYLASHGDALLLSSLENNLARATLAFMVKTLDRITRVLDGIARVPEWRKDILIVFDDEETYYRYVSRYYHEDGEFARSSGMRIGVGCSHFVTRKTDLRSVEPVIAHEMTHQCLGHLPIPAWLNEGIAVNTEHRLCPVPPSLFTPREMHDRHREFWGDAEIQEFWSGKSFLRNDEGNELSYDLARILVAQFSSDWQSFRAFALDADLADAGESAARSHLGIGLGAAVAAVLERTLADGWEPDPAKWREAPEKGGFRRA